MTQDDEAIDDRTDVEQAPLTRRDAMKSGVALGAATVSSQALTAHVMAQSGGPTDEISGVVEDANGAVENATVVAVPHDNSLDPLTTTTAADGTYTFSRNDLHDGENLYHVIARDGSESDPRRGEQNYPFIAAEGPVVPDGVTSHWRFGEGSGTTVADSEGSEDLSLSGPTWQSDSDSLDGNHLSFDGTDDEATASNTNNIFTDVSQLTVFVTFQPANTNDLRANLCGAYEADSDDRSWMFRHLGDLPAIRLQTSTDGSSVDVSAASFSESTDWRSFAATWDGSDGSVEFFIDATSIGTDTASTGSLFANGQSFYVGRAGYSGEDFTEGNIDNVAIADSVLTQSEIQDLHNLVPRF